jgi:hypothetical protein
MHWTEAWVTVCVLAFFSLIALRTRDYYVVVREFRIVTPKEFGKGQDIESSHLHCFDDYSAARSFLDLHEHFGATPSYETQQQINYLYAVSALTAFHAEFRMTRRPHHKARLLVETPHSALLKLKKHWDEERKARAEFETL